MPIITLRCPSIMASIAAAPNRLARIRSCAVGLPPRCKCPRIVTRTRRIGDIVFHTFRIVHRTTGQFTFGYKHDAAVLRLAETVLDEFFQLVHFRTELRNNGSLGSGCDSAVQGKETCIASHYLDEEKALVRSCGVADFVYGIQNRIQAVS